MKQQSKTALTVVGVTVAGYAVMELIHHGLIGGYVVPWLLSMGMSVSMAAYLSWALVALSVVAVGWLIYKFFVAVEE